MNHKKNIDSWFEYAQLSWLYRRSKPHFRTSVKQLIDKMKELTANHRHYGEAWDYLEKIEQLQGRFRDDVTSYPKESPSMLLECGIAAYEMGNSREAERLLAGSIGLYTEDHDRAIARWLLGCVHWHLENEIEAISAWEKSLQDFKEQVNKVSKTSDETVWYKEQISIMENAIEKAVNDRFPPPSPGSETNKSKNAIKTQGKIIQVLPLLGEIPAGSPRNIISDSSEFMEVGHVFLAGKEYCAESLIRGERIVNLSVGCRYFVLHVVGNSMNQSTPVTIENGNYVILREQNVAESGDIVAAEIVGVDSRATLKRFRKEPKAIFLIPESSAPEFKRPVYVERELKKIDEDFYIRGVAVAVLKPV